MAEAASFGLLQVEKLAAIETSRRVGHRLAELYPSERDRVRSYFRRMYRRARRATPTAVEPTAETATAANAA